MVARDTSKSKGSDKADAPALSNLQKMYAAGGLLDTFSIIMGTFGKASAIRAQGKFEEAGFIENARRLKIAEGEAIKQGQTEAAKFMKNIRQIEGTQTASLAAQGIDPSRGTAADIREETIEAGIEGMSTLRTNALRKAFGFKVQAIEQEFAARTTRIGRKLREKQTLLTGRLKIVSSVQGAGGKAQQAGSA